MIDLNTGHHKIGMSYSPEFREKTLQSEKPDIVTVYTRKFTNRKLAKDFEVELHKKYVHKRVRGEWFDLDSIEINEIIKLMRI
ncbi:MAG: GIY-YIG nuclease family protein [Flavobacterium sp.]|nr:GIY-YIG nuclease family protein [Flavobacterium sp.]